MRPIDADALLEEFSECNFKGHVLKNLIEAQPTIDPESLRPKGEWISVEDRLPKPETDVIVFGGGFIDILTYRYNRRGNIYFMYQDECGYWQEKFSPPVTHWMPLPEPPGGDT